MRDSPFAEEFLSQAALNYQRREKNNNLASPSESFFETFSRKKSVSVQTALSVTGQFSVYACRARRCAGCGFHANTVIMGHLATVDERKQPPSLIPYPGLWSRNSSLISFFLRWLWWEATLSDLLHRPAPQVRVNTAVCKRKKKKKNCVSHACCFGWIFFSLATRKNEWRQVFLFWQTGRQSGTNVKVAWISDGLLNWV